ncbi:hypothetical protein ACN28I_01445 [Archangium gephyra]
MSVRGLLEDSNKRRANCAHHFRRLFGTCEKSSALASSAESLSLAPKGSS